MKTWRDASTELQYGNAAGRGRSARRNRTCRATEAGLRCLPTGPNAGHQARLEADARHERTLEAVAWMPLLDRGIALHAQALLYVLGSYSQLFSDGLARLPSRIALDVMSWYSYIGKTCIWACATSKPAASIPTFRG